MFNVPLLRLLGQTEKVKAVRILQRFVRQIGLGSRKVGAEIGHGLTAALQQTGFDLDVQYVARPVVLDGLGDVPTPLLLGVQPVQQRQGVPTSGGQVLPFAYSLN